MKVGKSNSNSGEFEICFLTNFTWNSASQTQAKLTYVPAKFISAPQNHIIIPVVPVQQPSQLSTHKGVTRSAARPSSAWQAVTAGKKNLHWPCKWGQGLCCQHIISGFGHELGGQQKDHSMVSLELIAKRQA